MNEPFNIDEDGMFYDVPPTPPHTLTDERAGYDAPSEAAMEAAGNFIYVEWDSGAPPDDPEEYDSLNFYVGDMGVLFDDNDEARDWHTKLTTDLAKRFDAFAAQAVEAEQGRIKRVTQFLAANTTQRDVRDYVYVGDLLGSIDGGFNPPVGE